MFTLKKGIGALQKNAGEEEDTLDLESNHQGQEHAQKSILKESRKNLIHAKKKKKSLCFDFFCFWFLLLIYDNFNR